MELKGKKEGVFLSLLLLTGFFFLLEISFFIQGNRVYFSDFIYVSNQLSIPYSIIPGILFFIFSQIILHVLYCSLVFVIFKGVAYFLSVKRDNFLNLGIIIWFAGIILILLLNQHFFPNSKFSLLVSFFLPNKLISNIVLLLLSAFCVFFIIFGILGWLKYCFSIFDKFFGYGLFIGLISFSFSFIYIYFHQPTSTSTLPPKRPNIVIIGVDSLRPDFLSFFGSDRATPFFDSFLNQASVFSEAVTPLARTFPSWVSVFTGQYPVENNIRTDLQNQDHVNFQSTLPQILKKEGYETIFATDETRFSNIDHNIGFERIVSPPVGLNDFLLCTFNEFPLSNLLVNTFIGQKIFPYSYANRSVDFTYQPDSFLNLIKPYLKAERTKPLFLSIHFCLSHNPYVWSQLKAAPLNIQERYAESVIRVDTQVKQFFSLLEDNHLLDHAIVVLLSDHGEALEVPGDRITEKDLFISDHQNKQAIPQFYPPSLDEEAVNQSAGHGTDVLGLSQYHTVLAFRLYGFGQEKVKVYSDEVTLLDIKPTILAFLGLSSLKSSGSSLVDLISGKIQTLPKRHLFIESDFTPQSIQTLYPEKRKVMLEGIELFQIDPVTTRLTVKDKMFKMILESKQYAYIYDQWILALYPTNQFHYIPILVNLENGLWTDDLHSKFALQSPAQAMLQKLNCFYSISLNSKTLTRASTFVSKS